MTDAGTILASAFVTASVWDLAVGLLVGLIGGRAARWAADTDGCSNGVGPTEDHPAIEVGTAAIMALVIARFGLHPQAMPAVVVVIAVVATAVTDLRTHRIPDRIIGPALAVCLVIMAVVAVGMGQPQRLIWVGGGAVLYGGILFGIHLIVPTGLGRGDAKLGVLLGCAIGWYRPTSLAVVESVVWSLLVASLLGLILASLGHRLTPRRAGASLRHHRIAFGPMLSTATIGVVGLGDLFLGQPG